MSSLWYYVAIIKHSVSTPYGNTNIYSAENRPSSKAERVLVVPGYSEGLKHNKGLVDALARRGYDAFTFNQPRRKGKVEDPIQRQGRVILSLLKANTPQEEKGHQDEKIHAVGHSLAAAALLRAAIDAPEQFASITLLQPVGMVGEQSTLELAGRVNKKVARNQLSAIKGQDPDRKPKHGYRAVVDKESSLQFLTRVLHAQLVGGGVLVKQPALALREANSISGSKLREKYDITDDVAEVHKLGIPIHIVKAHGDELFDPDKVDATYEGIADSVDSFSSVADPKAGHDTSWMQPERTAGIVDELIHKE